MRPWQTTYTDRLLKAGNDYADFEAWERWMKKDKNCKRVLKTIDICDQVVLWAKMCEVADHTKEMF